MLLALVLQFLSPDTYFVNIAFTMIAAVVLGGSYHWVGSIIGAAVFTALPVIAQAIIPSFQEVANGIALLLIMIFLPRGLVDPRAIRLRRATRGSGADASRDAATPADRAGVLRAAATALDVFTCDVAGVLERPPPAPDAGGLDAGGG